MIFFNNFINLIKVIICWPTAAVLIVFMLRKDISKIADKINFQDKDIFKKNIELKSGKKDRK